MIHVFSYRNKNYIYDVGSGSLHECDKATADYLKAKEEGADIDITYITDEQVKEILCDVDALKAQGLLYKEEVLRFSFYFLNTRLFKPQSCAENNVPAFHK